MKENSTFNLCQKLWLNLEKNDKLKLSILCIFMFLSGFLEVLTIGSIVPFVIALTDSSAILLNPSFSNSLEFFNIQDSTKLILFLTIVFGFSVACSSAMRLFITKYNYKWCYEIIAFLGIKVFKVSLNQPYSSHQSKNSSDTVSGIILKTGSLLSSLILPVMTIIQTSVLILSILLTLIFFVSIENVLYVLFFGLLYALFSFFLKKRLDENSIVIAKEQVNALNALQESLSGIKDLILTNNYEFYSSKFSKAEIAYRKGLGDNAFISIFPRFFIEALGIILILFIISISIVSGASPSEILPLIAVLTISAQRVLPYLQQMYQAFAAVIGQKKVIIDALDQLNQPILENNNDSSGAVKFERIIEFKDISFKYPDFNNYALKNFNLRIRKGEKVGIIGITGSGKTTAVDLLMGLLVPTKGSILIDDIDLQDLNIIKWQERIGHVPQKIFISDSSILNNIALGVDLEDKDMHRVEESLKLSFLADFVQSLPDKINSRAGEDGSLLSGGQKQRVGIARALFRGGDLIVFDEATNALDNKTENSIMESLESLNLDKTILIIAHNLDTIKSCDTIVIVSDGKVVVQGPYDEISNSDHFKIIANQINTIHKGNG